MTIDLAIERIEAELQGTCKDVADVIMSDEDLDEVLRLIGERGNIERCECCSWWCESIEFEPDTGEYVCDDCRE